MGIVIIIVPHKDQQPPTEAEIMKFKLLCDEFTQEDGMSIAEAMETAAQIIYDERGNSNAKD